MTVPRLQVFADGSDGESEAVDTVCARLRSDEPYARSIELSRVSAAWPLLSILVHRGWCVLHLTTARNGRMFTLEGGTEPDTPGQVEFMYAGAPTLFTKEYLNSAAKAEEVVRAFATERAWPSWADWEEL